MVVCLLRPRSSGCCKFSGGRGLTQSEARVPADPLGGHQDALSWQPRKLKARPPILLSWGFPSWGGGCLVLVIQTCEPSSGKQQARVVLCQQVAEGGPGALRPQREAESVEALICRNCQPSLRPSCPFKVQGAWLCSHSSPT